MFFEIVIAILIGVLLGTITGLIPGIHINLVASILFSTSYFLMKYFSPLSIAIIMISMSITHTFTDFIPSIFLGAASDDTALGVLPGHVLLMKGKALLALALTVFGGIFSFLFTIALSPFFILFTSLIYELFLPFIPYVLIFASLFLILKQKEKNKIFWSAVVFILSGVLGLIALNSNFKEPLLPMLSGLFGVSILIYSLFKNTIIPPQDEKFEKINFKKAISPSFAGTLAAIFVSIFPALGPAHAAVLSKQFFRKLSPNQYLMMLGGINTVSMFFSLITLYTINKARNGSIIVVQKLIENFSLNEFFLFSIVSLIVIAIASFITLELGRFFAINIHKLNYFYISLFVIGLISIFSFLFSGFYGLIILVVATAIGLIANVMKVERTSAMGCLLVPVIFYFLL